MRITVSAPSNIALIKYWGKRSRAFNLALNSSLSGCLKDCLTTTTVETSETDRIGDFDPKSQQRILMFWNTLRTYGSQFHGIACQQQVNITSQNNFPKSAGIASSASGFAALVLGFEKFYQLNIPLEHKRGLARRGSGSASRSIDSSYCIWRAGSQIVENGFDDLTADQIEVFNTPLNLKDHILLISTAEKKVSSSDGHRTMDWEPFRFERKKLAENRVTSLHQLLVHGNFSDAITLIERDSLEMHGLMMMSGLFYWEPQTLTIMKDFFHERNLHKWPIALTIDAGPNLHFIGPETPAFSDWLKKYSLTILVSDII